ncbi:MAG: SIMPL domain-containing protein [Candidatus Omnitrophica bacterium]|nr:SIMPL domain-containing protein [Candidatus Omnitrophota bacterium]MDD5592780.1 SIMPL domain-containing protein [Candidatus Omnitrophota bacterium]
MEGGRILRNSQIIILGICIAVATIVSSMILSKGFLKITKFIREQITVTGSAQKEIKSDYIVWRGTFSTRQADLKTGYKKLNDDLEVVKKYLTGKGINEKEIVISQISTNKVYKKNEKGNDTNEIQWYVLSQAVEARSKDVGKVDKVSRESTELIEENIDFESQSPEYFYTKLDELKIEMLAKATENAKLRAENMVKATGNKIGSIRSARMGVFQITPITSTDVSDWGVNDTSSLEKKVMAVVSASFAIE